MRDVVSSTEGPGCILRHDDDDYAPRRSEFRGRKPRDSTRSILRAEARRYSVRLDAPPRVISRKMNFDGSRTVHRTREPLPWFVDKCCSRTTATMNERTRRRSRREFPPPNLSRVDSSYSTSSTVSGQANEITNRDSTNFPTRNGRHRE